jgi:hypothetical protein
MTTPPILTVDRLHRLAPSDLERLKARIGEPGLAEEILRVLSAYLAQVGNPSAVEADDITRIVHDLDYVGLWERDSAKTFLADMLAPSGGATSANISGSSTGRGTEVVYTQKQADLLKKLFPDGADEINRLASKDEQPGPMPSLAQVLLKGKSKA